MADSRIVKIPIIDGYYFSIDNLGNNTLYYKEKRERRIFNQEETKTGEYKEYEEILGYYSDLKWVLRAMIKDAMRRKINSYEIKTVQEYLVAYNSMLERLESTLRPQGNFDSEII